MGKEHDDDRRTATATAAPDVMPAPCSRRALLAGIPGLVVLPGALAACSGALSQGEAQSTAQTTVSVPETTLAASDVPVGGATIVDAGDEAGSVVVAQPTAGEFVAFSTACTHQGAKTKLVGETSLRCPLHGSQFDATTGEVTNPPAARPLDEVAVRAEGDQLVVGE